MARHVIPFGYWNNAFQLGMMAAEANAVIMMRIWGMTGFWAVAKGENARMVNEKIDAANKSLLAASHAKIAGKRPDQVIAAAIKPVRSKTRANTKRLAKRGPKIG